MTITLPQVEQAVTHYASFIKAHERLLVIVLAGFLLFHFGEKGVNVWDKYEERKATVAQQEVNAKILQTKTQDAVVANLQQQLNLVNKTANAAMAEAHKKTQEQRQIDQTLPLNKLADRWSVLIQAKPNAVAATMGIPAGTDISDTITVSSEASHATVDALELAAENAVALTNTQKQLGACAAVSAAQVTDLQNWKDQFNAEHNARLADAKVAKARETKAYLKGVKHGVIIGVAGTVVAVVAILH